MSKKAFLLPVASALTALLGGAGLAQASTPADQPVSSDLKEIASRATAGNDLVLRHAPRSVADLAIGERLATHYSHVSHGSHGSHASHESHSSHYSSSY